MGEARRETAAKIRNLILTLEISVRSEIVAMLEGRVEDELAHRERCVRLRERIWQTLESLTGC